MDSATIDILIVDDNQNNLTAMSEILAGEGVRLVAVNSGAQALWRVLEQDFAVILMDVQMPMMDGFEAAALIRDRERSRRIPIIFLTAFSQEEARVFEGYSLGAVDFLFKPIVPEFLKSKVAVFVDLYRKTEEVRLQAELLRAAAQREHEQRLVEERQRWEAHALREEMIKERLATEALARQAEAMTKLAEERKRAELAVQETNARLELVAAMAQKRAEALIEADSRKDEFVAMLAHELRNPLAPIGASLKIVQKIANPMEGTPLQRACTSMERQVRHMARLIDDLLDVARISQSKIELRPESLDLASAFEAALQLSMPVIQEWRHECSVSMPAKPIQVTADPVRLAQIISNLLVNAARYTEPGGHIWLSAERAGDEAIIRVRDDGIGLPAEMLSRVFELFIQVGRTAERKQGGLGIGLTLVRRLVELHGGSVAAYSDGLGKGCEFVVKLIADPEGSDEAGLAKVPTDEAATIAPTVGKKRARRIVVVEDNEDIRYTLEDLLRLDGHDVHVAADGLAGIALALQVQPEVVLIDIGLPGLDGYGVARRLRQELSPSVRLIAMTGYGGEKDRLQAMEAGFSEHLVKPINLDLLNRLIEETGDDSAALAARALSEPSQRESPLSIDD